MTVRFHAEPLSVGTSRLLQPGGVQGQSQTPALDGIQRPDHTMVSWLSHELKTPLAAIKACATALLSDTLIRGPDADARRELAESIDRETDRLLAASLDVARVWRSGDAH